MDQESFALLLNVAMTLGGLIAAILSFVAVVAWRIARGLSDRDKKIGDCLERVGAHEKDCAEFRGKILRRLDEGSAKFSEILSEISYMRGRMDEEVEHRHGRR